MCVILPAMQEDRWLVPEDPANRQQCAVVPLFVEIDRYLERYTNEQLRIMCEFWLKTGYSKVCIFFLRQWGCTFFLSLYDVF